MYLFSISKALDTVSKKDMIKKIYTGAKILTFGDKPGTTLLSIW